MANRVFSNNKIWNLFLPNNISKINCYSLAITRLQERQLYSRETLGIESFVKQKEFVEKQMSNISEKFKEKIGEYCKDVNKNMIFSEDLKNMIYLASSSEDLEVIITMMKKYNQQNKQIRFGNFVFGPVVMRLFYIHNVPDKALECFKSPELEGFFDQIITYQILLDLLYENKRYQDILDTLSIIKGRQIEGQKYPRNVIVLVMAACYKMNSKESLDYALKLWKELMETGHSPMRRAVTFCAALALNQNEPGIAIEIVSFCRNQNYMTVRNLKIAALAEVGRIEQVIPLLKSVLSEDLPHDRKHTFNKETIDRLKTRVAEYDNTETVAEINNIIGTLESQGHVIEMNAEAPDEMYTNIIPMPNLPLSDIIPIDALITHAGDAAMSMDEQLCQEIQKPPIMNSREVFQKRNMTDRSQDFSNRRRVINNNRRPGLHELV